MAVYIQDRFTIDRDGIRLDDAIVLPEDEYKKLSPTELDAMKESRYTNWVFNLKNPPQPVEVNPEVELTQVADQIKSLTDQLDQLTVKKVELQTAIGISVDPIEEKLADPVVMIKG